MTEIHAPERDFSLGIPFPSHDAVGSPKTLKISEITRNIRTCISVAAKVRYPRYLT